MRNGSPLHYSVFSIGRLPVMLLLDSTRNVPLLRNTEMGVHPPLPTAADGASTTPRPVTVMLTTLRSLPVSGSRVAGDHLVLRANDKYHAPAPYLDRIIFKYIPDLTVLYTQFRTGAVITGMQGISAEFYAKAKGLPGVTVHPHATPSVRVSTSTTGIPSSRSSPSARRSITASTRGYHRHDRLRRAQAGGGIPAHALGEQRRATPA